MMENRPDNTKTEVARITQEMVERARPQQPIPHPRLYTAPVLGDFEERGNEVQLAELYCSLAKARGEFQPFKKSKSVVMKKDGRTLYSFDYAPMEVLLDATVPALSRNGIVVLMPFVTGTEQTTKQLVIVAHASGGRLVFKFEFTPAGDEKTFAGQTTYLQRYCYRSVLALAADSDLEEQPRPGEGPVEVKQNQAPAKADQRPAEVRLISAHSVLLGEMLALAKKVGLTKRSQVAELVFGTVSNGEVFPLGEPFCSELTAEQLEQCLHALTARLPK